MQPIKELSSRFSSPGLVDIAEGRGGMVCVKISNPLADADIYLHGATVTHFQPKGQRPVLWLASNSLFKEGKAIRGGIPICWPWFGPAADKGMPQHGFARHLPWDLLEIVQTSDKRTRVILQLKSSQDTLALFPHEFVLTYTLVIGSSLEAELSVYNPGLEPFSFTEALHTYLRVSDVEKASLTGLRETAYLDKVKDMQHFVQLESELAIAGRVDRVYTGTAEAVLVKDAKWYRILRVEKTGARDTVIWNPHLDLAKTMPEIGEKEWRDFVCVEAVNSSENPLTLAPLGTHVIGTRVTIFQ